MYADDGTHEFGCPGCYCCCDCPEPQPEKAMNDLPNVFPGPGKILVRVVNPLKTDGGILIPETVRERDKEFGIVVRAGEGVDWLQVGDEALFGPANMLVYIQGTDRQYALTDADFVWGGRRPAMH